MCEGERHVWFFCVMSHIITYSITYDHPMLSISVLQQMLIFLKKQHLHWVSWGKSFVHFKSSFCLFILAAVIG